MFPIGIIVEQNFSLSRCHQIEITGYKVDYDQQHLVRSVGKGHDVRKKNNNLSFGLLQKVIYIYIVNH